jgi:hypothetical protein
MDKDKSRGQGDEVVGGGGRTIRPHQLVSADAVGTKLVRCLPAAAISHPGWRTA